MVAAQRLVASVAWFAALTQAVDERDLDPWRFEKQRVERYVRWGNGTVYLVAAEVSGDGKVLCEAAVSSGARIPTDAFKLKGVERHKDEDALSCAPRHPERARSWHGLPEAAAFFASHFKVSFYAIYTRLPAALAFSRFAFVGVVRDPLHAIAGSTEGDPKRVKQYVNKQVAHYAGCARTVNKILTRVSTAGRQTDSGKTWSLPQYRVGFEYAPKNGSGAFVDVPDLAGYVEQRMRHRPNCAQSLMAEHVPTREDLAVAKTRLDRFSVVAPMDRLSEIGPLLKAKFGYARLGALGAFNYTAFSKPELDVLAKAKRSAMVYPFMRNTNLDRDLHIYAGKLLDAQLEATRNSWEGAVIVGRDTHRPAEIGGLTSVKVHPAAARIAPPAVPRWADLPVDEFPIFTDLPSEPGFGTAVSV